MDGFITLIENLSGFIWGGTWGDLPNGDPNRILPVGIIAVVLLGTGLFFMIRLGLRPLRRFFPAVGELWAGRKAQGKEGDITPWQALSTALSGQVGTGNLAGVATAISLGGPGAIFWMWITALFGMAAAFAESSLAVRFRETHKDGHIHGGPMFYIKNGLNGGKGGLAGPFGWLAVLFCIGAIISAVSTGGMIQANSFTQAMVETGRSFDIGVPTWLIGAIVAGLVFAVIIGGITSIGSVAGKIVPFMAVAYVITAAVVLVLNFTEIPEAFRLIFANAFGFEQAFGGVAGYGVLQAVRFGIARGLFSNEAGQGSAPIAHAAAKTKSPVAQGEIASIGVFIDTIILCTMTALVLLTVSGDFKRNFALDAAKACSSAQAAPLPEGLDRGATLDLFPSASAGSRVEILADGGPTARAYLEGCLAGQEAAANDRLDRVLGEIFGRISQEALLNAAYPPGLESVDGPTVAALSARASGEAVEAEAIAALSPEAAAARLAELNAAAEATLTPVRYSWLTDADSSAITTRAYSEALPGGQLLITIALAFFTFTTMIGWSYYAQQAASYLVGDWASLPIRFLWVLVVFLGAQIPTSAVSPDGFNVDTLWLLGDFSNAAMAFPNLIAILLLSGLVATMAREADEAHRRGGGP